MIGGPGGRALTGEDEGLDIYDISTGKHLAARTTWGLHLLWFTPDGREVWSAGFLLGEGWKIIKDSESDAIELEPLPRFVTSPSLGGYPWTPPNGHKITDDGWILCSRKTRVIWLPHRWRKDKLQRICDGRFLGLLDSELSEPVILELDE